MSSCETKHGTNTKVETDATPIKKMEEVTEKDDTEHEIRRVLQQIEMMQYDSVERKDLESKLEWLLLGTNKQRISTKNERDLECYQLLRKYHELKETKIKDEREIKLVHEELVRRSKEQVIQEYVESVPEIKKIQEELQKLIGVYEEQFNVLEAAFRRKISKIDTEKTNERKIVREDFQRKKEDLQGMRSERIEKLAWLERELSRHGISRHGISRHPIIASRETDWLYINIHGMSKHDISRHGTAPETEWLYINIPNSSKVFKLQMDYALKSSKYLTNEVKAQKEPKTILTVKAASEASLSFIIKYITDTCEKKLYTSDIHGTKAALKFQGMTMDRPDNFILDVVHDSSLFELPILTQAAQLLYRELYPNVHV